MLGFSIKGASATSRSKFGKVSNIFAIDDVQCDGSESHIRLCPHTSRENCGSTEGAGVICGPKIDTERVMHDILHIKTLTRKYLLSLRFYCTQTKFMSIIKWLCLKGQNLQRER